MIGDVCVKPVVTVSKDTTVQEAARLMRAKKVGALVVVNNGKPEGILTDRDITVNVVAQQRDPEAVRVREVMRTNPTVIREDQGILDAARILGARGVRRLPVVGKGGKLVGIVALDDLLMLFGREMGHVASALARGAGGARGWRGGGGAPPAPEGGEGEDERQRDHDPERGHGGPRGLDPRGGPADGRPRCQ